MNLFKQSKISYSGRGLYWIEIETRMDTSGNELGERFAIPSHYIARLFRQGTSYQLSSAIRTYQQDAIQALLSSEDLPKTMMASVHEI